MGEIVDGIRRDAGGRVVVVVVVCGWDGKRY